MNKRMKMVRRNDAGEMPVVRKTALRKTGFTLIELLMAIGIMGVCLVMSMALFAAAIAENQNSFRAVTGKFICENGIAIVENTVSEAALDNPTAGADDIDTDDFLDDDDLFVPLMDDPTIPGYVPGVLSADARVVPETNGGTGDRGFIALIRECPSGTGVSRSRMLRDVAGGETVNDYQERIDNAMVHDNSGPVMVMIIACWTWGGGDVVGPAKTVHLVPIIGELYNNYVGAGAVSFKQTDGGNDLRAGSPIICRRTGSWSMITEVNSAGTEGTLDRVLIAGDERYGKIGLRDLNNDGDLDDADEDKYYMYVVTEDNMDTLSPAIGVQTSRTFLRGTNP